MRKAFAATGAALLSLSMACLLVVSPGCKKAEKKKAAAPTKRLVSVTVAAPQTKRVVYTLEQVGSMVASDRAVLRSQVAGAVAEIRFKEGGRVKKGEVMVRLDDIKIQADMRNLLARLEQLKVRLDFKTKTVERNRSLLKRSAIPQHSFDQILSEQKETELAISQVRADLARQRDLLTNTIVRAPFDGVAGSKDLSVGDYLKVGEKVAEVVVLNPLEIAFQVPERYKSRISLGQKVSLRVASEPGRNFEGVIFFISPTVEIKTRSFLVKARVDNGEGRLNPGMFTRVSMVTEVHPKATVVPWDSVVQTEDETYIYLVRDGKAQKLAVKLGKVTNDWAEILDAHLPPDSKVVVDGKYAAKNGAPVRLAGPETATNSAKK